MRFVLAGSGHIAGVVNPPDAKKYQYWINEKPCNTLDEYAAGAAEHPGSWWPGTGSNGFAAMAARPCPRRASAQAGQEERSHYRTRAGELRENALTRRFCFLAAAQKYP